LLEEGLAGRRDRLDAAKQHYKQAYRICANDPRLYYACGLVLLKHNRPLDAKRQFERGCEQEGVACLPAWQALILCNVKDKKYHSALSDLGRLAQSLENGRGRDAVTSDPESAQWIGRMMGFLEQTAANRRTVKEGLTWRDQEIRETLTDAHRQAYENGREAFLKEYERAADIDDRRRRKAEETRGNWVKEKTGEAMENQDRVEDGRQKQRLGKRVLEQQFRDQIKRYQEIDANLQKKYVDLEAQKGSLAINLQRMLARLPSPRVVQMPLGGGSGIDSRDLWILDERKKLSRMIDQQREAIEIGQAELRRLRTQLWTEFRAFLVRNQVAAVEIERLGREIEELEEQADRRKEYAEDDATNTPVIPETHNSPNTYFRPDFEAEKKRLLASFRSDAGKRDPLR
jgi:hypothetical protein